MSIAITSQTRSFKKVLLIGIAAAAVAGVGLFFALQQSTIANAVQPGDVNLKHGDLITAFNQAGDPDVFVVKEVSPTATRRVFKNPTIGRMYGQFGKDGIFTQGVIKQFSPARRDAFVLGCYVRNAETNDPKVYYVESTGADTGAVHWINMSADTVNAADPMFFPKTFDINTAEYNFYAMGAEYTSMSQIPVCTTGEMGGTPTPLPGNVSVSLSANTPGATTVTTNAQGVEFLRVRLSGTGTVTGMTFDRTGPGSTDDFDNVYIYDGARRLVSGKSFNSGGSVTFSALNLAVGGTRDLSFVGDLSATAGNVNAIKLSAVTLANGTVSGLPVLGNNIAVSGASSGTITLAKTG